MKLNYNKKKIFQSRYCASSNLNKKTLIVYMPKEKIILINEGASIIWKKIEKPITFENLFKQIKNMDDLFSKNDLVEFLNELKKEKLIEIK